ncbi:MAG: ATPase, T2SS/T4P/T4SS family [bacterium]
MSVPVRTRANEPQEDSDEWLIDAARRAGHALPRRDRPAGTSAWRMLLNAGVSEEEILRLACAASGADAADFTRVSPALNSYLPHAVALRYRVAPLGVRNGVLGVATFNPRSPHLERELAFASKHRVSLLAAGPGAILRAQAAIYGTVYGTVTASEPGGPPMPAPSVAPPQRPPHVARLSLAVAAPSETSSQAQNLADRLLTTAITERASEAHLEPAQEGGLLVRLRVDGTLNDRFGVSEANMPRVIHSLKTRAGLDVGDTHSRQSGRATFVSPQGVVELRISTEPMPKGLERLVVRLYSPQSALGITELGFSASERHRFEELLGVGSGLVLVVGPHSAGKTTTLYAAARALKEQGRRVVTVEEPVERRLDGITQTDVSASPYPTVASAVRAMLYADTDVVLVGALTDTATTESVVTGSAKKRFVLAALETSDMASALQRLYDLEHDSVALSGAIRGVVAQRLLRCLCDACAAPQHLSDLPEPQQQLLSGLPNSKLRSAVGCERCRGTGYDGRTAVVEVVPITPELRAAIARRADAPALAQLARECGIHNLWDSGMNCVVEGITSLSELLDHVVPPPQQVGEGTVAQHDIDALLAQLLGGTLTATTVEAAPAPPPRQQSLRILLVDDDVVARRSLAGELTRAGVTVLEAADGEAALAYARRLRPDFIISEVALPKLDAMGLLKALAEDASPPPVIIHTAQEDQAMHGWLQEAGAMEIISRKVAGDALAARLNELAVYLSPQPPA